VGERGLISFMDREGFFLFVIASRRSLGPTQPPVHWVPPGIEAAGLVPKLRMHGDVCNSTTCLVMFLFQIKGPMFLLYYPLLYRSELRCC